MSGSKSILRLVAVCAIMGTAAYTASTTFIPYIDKRYGLTVACISALVTALAAIVAVYYIARHTDVICEHFNKLSLAQKIISGALTMLVAGASIAAYLAISHSNYVGNVCKDPTAKACLDHLEQEKLKLLAEKFKLCIANAGSNESLIALCHGAPPAPQQPSPAPSTDSIPVIDGRNMTPITLQDGQCVTARWIQTPAFSVAGFVRFKMGNGDEHDFQSFVELVKSARVNIGDRYSICSSGGPLTLSNRRPE